MRSWLCPRATTPLALKNGSGLKALRAAGKALVAASHGSLITSEAMRIDGETGLSVADLRELVLEARVVEVKEREAVPLAETGYLRQQ